MARNLVHLLLVQAIADYTMAKASVICAGEGTSPPPPPTTPPLPTLPLRLLPHTGTAPTSFLLHLPGVFLPHPARTVHLRGVFIQPPLPVPLPPRDANGSLHHALGRQTSLYLPLVLCGQVPTAGPGPPFLCLQREVLLPDMGVCVLCHHKVQCMPLHVQL